MDSHVVCMGTVHVLPIQVWVSIIYDSVCVFNCMLGIHFYSTIDVVGSESVATGSGTSTPSKLL